MKPSDVLELTIGELDDLFDGFAENNDEDSDHSGDKPLEGKDAVDELRRIGMLK